MNLRPMWERLRTLIRGAIYAGIALFALVTFGRAAIETGEAIAIIPFAVIAALIAWQLTLLAREHRTR